MSNLGSYLQAHRAMRISCFVAGFLAASYVAVFAMLAHMSVRPEEGRHYFGGQLLAVGAIALCLLLNLGMAAALRGSARIRGFLMRLLLCLAITMVGAIGVFAAIAIVVGWINRTGTSG